MMKYTPVLLLLLAASCCHAAPRKSAEDDVHERVRRTNPTNLWWISGSTSTTSSSSRHVSCGLPGTPQHGTSLFESVRAGAIVVHSCDPGHRLEGAKLRLCQSNGRWTPQLPRCVLVDCGDPGAPLNGNKWVGATFLGSIVKYKCDNGFHLVGNNFRVCQDNGKWDGQVPTCQAPPCPKLPSPPNGKVTITGQGASALARYQCNSGFRLVGSDTRTCQNGVWQGKAPLCQAVTCPTLPDIEYGRVIVSSNSVNSVARYVCNAGFELVGSTTRVCQSNGQWSGREPECKEVGCRVLQDPLNGRVSLTGTSVGSEASYTCDSGFILVGYRVRVCQAGGEWSTKEPVCQAAVVRCGSLKSPLNGRVTLTGVTLNSVARYKCDSGFELVGSSERVCQADGSWSSEAPFCRVLGCTELPNIANGRVFLTGTSPGALATYICESGFRLEGARNRVCQVNGQWSAEEPTCVQLSCGRLENPENGQVTVSGVVPGSVARYTCNPGFELVGVATRICLQNEQWSNDAPFCRASQLEFAFSEVSYEVREGDGFATVVVELISGTVSSPTLITVSISDLSAMESIDSFGCFDYTSTSVTVTFPAGTAPSGPGSQGTVNIPINDDNCVERPESFRVTATSTDSDVTFPRGDSSTVTINDNDIPLFRFTEPTYTVSESEGPAQPAIELFSDTVLTFSTTVRVVDIQGGTATDGVDYSGVSVNVVFPTGSSRGSQESFNIQIIDDQLVEGDETILLEASTDAPGEVPSQSPGRDQATVIIRDNDVVLCERLQDIANGKVILAGLTVGASAGYKCDTGFELVGGSTRTCQSNGFWSGVEPFCIPVQCEFLEAPENGRVVLRGTTFGSEAVYSCFPGFTLSGVDTRICQENGEWSEQAPTCTAISCGDLEAPANGQVTLTGTVFNSLAIYSCDDGFSLVGSSARTCMANGQWSGQAPTCVSQRCGLLDNPQNGRIDITGFTAGSTATYSCFPGFSLVGSSTRTCQPNGVWSGSAPFCRGVTCGVLTAPQNGRVTLSGTQVRDTATYECLPGFELQGASVRVCQPSGQWSLQEPTCNAIDCGSLTAPQNGAVVLSGTTFLSTARYSCETGFGLVGSIVRTCEADGEWSSSAPICQIAQCPDLDLPANGNIETTGTDFWDTAIYLCNRGFNLVGEAIRTCQANGAWSGNPPFCAPAQCPVLQPPKDGQVQFTSTGFGAVATYVCHGGFALVGNEQRTCEADGTWSGSIPICTRIDCGLLPIPKNGDISFSAGTVYGSVATYSCEPPFQLAGTTTRVCLETGEWSGEAPFCESLECPGLSAPENGAVDQNGFIPGSTASYVCNSGFNLIGDQRRICQTNGFWTGVAPLCQRAECDELKPPDSGDVELSGRTIGSHATYSCEDGFELVGDEFRSCQANGEWSGSEPSCEAVDCGSLNDPRNGIVEVTGTKAGDTATYRCNNGFVLFGKGIRECHEDGNWNGKAPECREVNCGRLNNPTNGFVSFVGTTFGLTATYNCDPGFEIVGFSSRVCEITGTWSGEEPLCTADVCPMLVAPTNGDVSQGVNQFGDTALYSCNLGFTLAGGRIRTCLDGGRWSGVAPVCEGISCGVLQAPENGRVIFLDGTSLGSIARYECNTGFTLSGIPIRSCDEDGSWSGVEPVCETVQCEGLRDPVNGRVSISGASFGSQAIYTCLSRFLLVGPELRECTADGTWSLNAPVCVTAEGFNCDQLEAPQNGRVRVTGTIPGSVATYSCNLGFNLLGGTENRICVEGSGWNGLAPTCQPVDCGRLLSPLNGQVLLVQGTALGARAMYNCDQGFVLLGVTVRQCEASGEWSAIEPTCSPIQCARLPNPLNGQVTFETRSLGSIATYSCEEGFRLDGLFVRVCESDGDWSGRAPTCIRTGPDDCGDPGVPVNGRRTGDDFRLGASVYYECDEGFQLLGTASRICQDSGLWSGLLPTCAPADNECTNGSTSFDACGRRCTCVNGQFVDCCRIRVDFATMSEVDKNRLISAIIQVATDPEMKPKYDALIALYKSSFDTLAQSTDPSISQFLPWNRFFLIQYENLLREIDCRITVPYWDWTSLPLNAYMSPVFSPLSGFGDSSRSNDSCVNNGPFNFAVFSITPSAGGGCLQRQYRMQMFPTRAIVDQDLLTLPAEDFTQFHQFLQVFIHTNVRCFVGGQMCSTNAGNDPVFLLHLVQIDFLFDRWQRIDTDRLNARFVSDNSSLVLSTNLRVLQFANNENLADNVCILYDHPDFKSHVPPPMRFLADALEQMTNNHNLKMECVADSDMKKAKMGSKAEDFMHKMCQR